MSDHSHTPADMQNSVVVGIDLGTTNSLIAVVENGQPKILKTREGERLLPSVVTLSDGKIVIGYSAKKRKVRDAEHTVFSAKRLLGRGLKDIESFEHQLPYKVEKADDGTVKIRIGNQSYSAIEISAQILKELKLSAEQALGHPVKKAVITVPAYFNDAQRQATRAAGRLAGLEVLRILNEPTAASLAYGLQSKREGIIAVFDLGGGTFDLSILRLRDGIFEVLATHGDTQLGGDDFDRVIYTKMSDEVRAQLGIDVASDVYLRAALLEASESLKHAFSESEKVDFKVNLCGQSFIRPWTRAEFENLSEHLLSRAKTSCDQALKDAGLTFFDITDVVLVGGPTRLPMVQKAAEKIFGRKPNTSVHPDEVVALGAAIQGDILSGKNRDLLLLDVVPLTLGIETYGGVMSPLITRNTRIPASAKENFTTFVDNQTGVDIHVLQGEREKADENRSLARFKLGGIEPNPAGFPRVEVEFLIDADGILQVSARDLRSGKEQTVEVRPSFGLNDQAIEKMLEAAAAHGLEDAEFKRWIEVFNQAEPVLRSAEKKLPDAYRLLSKPEAERIESICKSMRAAIGEKNPEKVQNFKYELNDATVKLAEKIIRETLNRAKQ